MISRLSTSPSGEKLRAEIAVINTVPDAAASKFGSPGGPLASKTFILVTLHCNEDTISRIISQKYQHITAE